MKKAETIYTTRKQMQETGKKRNRHFDNSLWHGASRTMCYVTLNGIAMPAMRGKSPLCLAA